LLKVTPSSGTVVDYDEGRNVKCPREGHFYFSNIKCHLRDVNIFGFRWDIQQNRHDFIPYARGTLKRKHPMYRMLLDAAIRSDDRLMRSRSCVCRVESNHYDPLLGQSM